MNIDRVIWDFNGTILDDVDTGIEAVDVLLAKYGLPELKSRERYYEVFGFPIIDYYRRIGFDFEKTDYSILANEWVEIYLEKVKNAPLRDEIYETVVKIRDMGIKQTVFSMTQISMLKHQLELLNISDLFDEICGLDDIYASSKLALAESWRKAHPEEKTIYIGDTSHDVESSKIIGSSCFLLSGGHERLSELEKTGVPIINSPTEILSLI